MKPARGVVLAIVALAAAWFAAEWWMHRRATPPSHVADIASFLAWRPGTEQFTVVTDGTGEHVMAEGSRAGLLLPSGPPAYVFDSGGKLIDWTADVGDDSRFAGRWRAGDARGSGKTMGRAGLSSWLTGR